MLEKSYRKPDRSRLRLGTRAKQVLRMLAGDADSGVHVSDLIRLKLHPATRHRAREVKVAPAGARKPLTTAPQIRYL